MNWTVAEIRCLFNGRLIGNLYMKEVVCKNSIGFEQTDSEIKKQEFEAERFVETYFEKDY